MGCVPTNRRVTRQPVKVNSARNSVRNSMVEVVPARVDREDFVVHQVPAVVTVPVATLPPPQPVVNVIQTIPTHQQTPTITMLPGPTAPPIMRPSSPSPIIQHNPQISRQPPPSNMFPPNSPPQMIQPIQMSPMAPPFPQGPMTMASQRNYIPNIPIMPPIYHQPPPLVHTMAPNSLSSTSSPRSMNFDGNSQRSNAPNFGVNTFAQQDNPIPTYLPPPMPLAQPITSITNLSLTNHQPAMNSPRSNVYGFNGSSSRNIIEQPLPPMQPPPSQMITTLSPINHFSAAPSNSAEIMQQLNRESADVNDENFIEIKIEKMDFGTTKAY